VQDIERGSIGAKSKEREKEEGSGSGSGRVREGRGLVGKKGRGGG
jgi:hypothetical protein